MKLAYKLSTALVFAVLAVNGVFAWVRVGQEAAGFDRDVRRKHRVLGTTVATSVTQLWHHEGQEAATALVHRLDASRSGVSIRWVSLAPGAARHETARLPLGQLVPVTRGQTVQAVLPKRHAEMADFEDELLCSYFPTLGPSGEPAAIELVESLAPKSVYVANAIRGTLAYGLAVAIVCGALAVLLGAHYVGRPMAKLVERARQIGRGQLEPSLGVGQDDEFGTLAVELDAMAKQLGASEARMTEEAEARIQALEQLRHAERLTTVGKLASAVAHEVGTPINVVAGHAKLIAQGKVQGGEVLSSAQTIVEQCSRMTQLMRNLLDYARRRPPHRVHADLRDILNEAVQLLTPLAAGRQVTLEVKAEEPAPALVDPGQLQQALANLIINAVHASASHGSVELVLERVVLARPERTPGPARTLLRITVLDHGTGVEARDLPRLFEPFFSTKPSGEGTGLGLSIAQTLVEEHGGWISVDSELGRGTRFDVYLAPLSDPCPDTSSSSTTTTPRSS